MTGTTKSLGEKDALDRFYTMPDIASHCISLIDNIDAYDTIIEPSAGAGSFSNLLNCIAYDIAPNAEGITEADWFAVDKKQFSSNSLVIGNPPYGVQCNTAIGFFNESAKFARTVAFILPLSFKKRSIQDRLNRHFWLEAEWTLPANSFTLNGKDYDVPCVFQVWTRRIVKRKKLKQVTTTHLFQFVKHKSEADFRIQRVGGNAGKASYNLDVSEQSNYFVKNTSTYTNDELMGIINNAVFEDISCTVGPKSLSKTELILTLEEIVEESEDTK